MWSLSTWLSSSLNKPSGRGTPKGLPTLAYIGHGIMTRSTLTLGLKLDDLTDSRPVGAKLEKIHGRAHPTILVASECCLASTQPCDVHHVSAGDF